MSTELTDDPPVLTVVHAPACHFCHDAEEALDALAGEHRFERRVVEIESDEGRRLVAHHRPAMNPLVLVDGEFFSSGRLPRKKLVRLLRSRAAAVRTGA
jgi:glutaredoxin